jgi:hypothetical protein
VRDKAGIGAGNKLALVSWEKDGRVCGFTLIKVEELTDMVRGASRPDAGRDDCKAAAAVSVADRPLTFKVELGKKRWPVVTELTQGVPPRDLPGNSVFPQTLRTPGGARAGGHADEG